MPKYTPLCISRWIVLGPRRWVWLLLIVGLVVAVSFPSVAEPPSVWVWPDERGWFWQRPSRVGRWVWGVWQVMWASRWSLMCRVGLLAGLVAASGMVADCPRLGQVVWLPVVEWVLGVLGWAWPWLGRTQRYRDVRTLVHAAYLMSMVGLGLLVVQRWLHGGLSGVVLGSLVVCERDSSRVELEAAPGAEGRTTYRARLSGEFVIEVTPRDEFEKRLFILTLRQLRTPGREGSRWGIVRQEDLAQVFEVFQEHISRWQAYVREGQWAQLLSVSDKSLLTDDLRQQIVEVWAARLRRLADGFTSVGAFGAAGCGGD